jgi:hypothetical protein
MLPLVGVGLYDIFFSYSNVLSNYPLIGHLRYMLEFIRPELRQYFFESEQSGRPFNREQRTWVDTHADGHPDTQQAVLENCWKLIGAIGLDHPDKLTPGIVLQRLPDGSARPVSEIYPYLAPGALVTDDIHPAYARDWQAASVERF